ncbi:MAG TPA: type II secretion system F family protein, partial [Phycisphaeraceae bacterium]
RGEPISAAFADGRLISPSVYEAVRSGEATGQIGPLLLNVASFLEEENEVLLRSLTSLLEPLILIGLGLVVGLVAMSMFLPLFDLTASAGGG